MSDTGSDESSDSEAESSQAAASTHEQVAHTALAQALRSCELKKLIDEHDWHNKENQDFHHRTVVQQYHYSGAQGIRARSESPSSDGSSMAVSVHTHSAAIGSPIPSSYAGSSYTPSLGSFSTARSISSVRTSRAGSVLAHVLDVDEIGVAQAPASQINTGRLACPFRFLDCPYRSDNLEEWDIHSQSHLRGRLPKEVHCPFKCKWTESARSGEEAWQTLIMHIVAAHSDEAVDTSSRPKKSLIEHLWRNRIIDDAQKKELIRYGRLVGEVHTTSSGIRDRRNDRR